MWIVAKIKIKNFNTFKQELTKKTGKLSVPVTVIGEEIISGYNREKIGSVLDGILSPQ